jgi:hypothetical protein
MVKRTSRVKSIPVVLIFTLKDDAGRKLGVIYNLLQL